MGRTSQNIRQKLHSIFVGLFLTLFTQLIDLIVGLLIQSVHYLTCLTASAMGILILTMIAMAGPVIAPISSGILKIKVSKNEKVRQNVHYRLKMAFYISALTLVCLFVAFYASYVKESLSGAMIAVIVSVISQFMATCHMTAYATNPVSTGLLKE